MKKIMSIALSLVVILSQFVSVMAYESTNNGLLTKMISGTIVNETDNTIEVKASNSDNSVVLNILPSTYIIDAVTGAPVMLKDRIDDTVVVNYGPTETRSLPPRSNAVAVICNIPQDYIPPHYAKVEAIEENDNELKVTTDGGSLIVTIKRDVPIWPYRTKNMVSIDDIHVGTELILWYSVVAMSYPGQATTTKTVILGQDEEQSAAKIISSLTEEQLYKKDGVTYVRLSDVATSLGFHVEWNGANRTVSMSKNTLSIGITIGKKDYDYVDSIQQLTNPPFILNGRTFVESDFINTLIK